jgi:O-antigen/teichoic acid export membrane protein
MAEQQEGGLSRDLIKHTLIYGSGWVTMAIVSFVLTPVYTRHLSLSDYGLLALMLVFYGLMRQVYDLGMTNSVSRFFFDQSPDGEQMLPRIRVTSNSFVAVYGGALTLVLVLWAGTWARLLTGASSHADLVRIVAVTLYAEALAIVPLTLIRMQERSARYVTITLVRFAVTLALSVWFVAGLNWGVRGAMLGTALPAAGVLILLLPEYRLALGAAPSLALLRRMLAFGLPFFPVLLAAWVIDGSDRYIIEFFRTRGEVGYYSLSYRVAAALTIPFTAFAMGWAPLRYKIYERADARAVYRRLTTHYVIGSCVLGVGLAAFAAPIVRVLAPPSYSPAADVIPVLVLANVINGMNLMVVTGMGVSKRTGPMAPIAIAGALLNVGLNLALVPAFGPLAAAASTAAAFALMVAGNWLYSQRAYPIAYDWSTIGRIGGIAVVTVVVSAVFAPGGLLAGALWSLACWVAFVLALIATGSVKLADVAALRGNVLREVAEP